MAHEPRYANGAARRALRERLRSERRPCWICKVMGKSPKAASIDYSLRFPHPYSFVIDELVPVSKYWLGGYPTAQAAALDYANLAAAHKRCNEWRSNKTVDEVMRIAKGRKGAKRLPSEVKTSRDWRNGA